MDLINLSPVPARVLVTTDPVGAERIGMLVAKATFSLTGGSQPHLDADVAEPILDDDVMATDGLLPGDLVTRRDPSMEVILLGQATAPEGRPVARSTVSLAVGRFRREIAVFGERHWVRRWGRLTISDPDPFTSVPLCWSRAFGGRATVWLDRKATIEVADPINCRGRGFDPRPLAQGLCRHLNAPDGYPVVPSCRPLPNLEDPRRLICHPDQQPVPACWATVPRDVGVGMLGTMYALEAGSEVDPNQAMLGMLYRCHPAWVLPPLARAVEVRWSGLGPAGGAGFRLPALRVLADAVVGEQHSTLELRPQVLVLRPDVGRFHLTYRGFFRASDPKPGPRALRLRVAEGWMS